MQTRQLQSSCPTILRDNYPEILKLITVIREIFFHLLYEQWKVKLSLINGILTYVSRRLLCYVKSLFTCYTISDKWNVFRLVIFSILNYVSGRLGYRCRKLRVNCKHMGHTRSWGLRATHAAPWRASTCTGSTGLRRTPQGKHISRSKVAVLPTPPHPPTWPVKQAMQPNITLNI